MSNRQPNSMFRPAVVVLCAAWLPCGCVAVRGVLVDPVRRAVARQHVSDGERLQDWSQPQAAQAAFRRAVKADPHNAAAHGRLGEMFARDGKHERASQEYRLALRSNPNHLGYALGLGDSLRHSAETSMQRSQLYAAAIRVYRYARSLYPDSFQAAIGLGLTLHQTGAHRQAAETLMEVQRLRPASTDVHSALAAAYEALGDEQAAFRQYEMTLELDPDNLFAHNQAARINLRISRRGGEESSVALGKARRHLRRSLRIDSAQPRIRELLIQCGPDPRRIAASPEIISSEP